MNEIIPLLIGLSIAMFVALNPWTRRYWSGLSRAAKDASFKVDKLS